MFEWNRIIPDCVTSEGVATLKCVPAVFLLVLNFALSFAGIAALFFVVLAGFKFMTSGGDAKQAEGARKTLTYAIIGLIVIFLSFWILNLIATVFMPGNPQCLTTFSLLTGSPCK